MKLNWRAIPTPTYAWYGGANAKCKEVEGCPIPVDGADAAYLQHDGNLDDWQLFKNLLRVNPKDLKGTVDFGWFKTDNKIVQTGYLGSSLLIFGIAGGITKLNPFKKKT